MPTLPSQNPGYIEPVSTLTGESIEALRDLGDILQAVHYRLSGEGYIIKDSKYVQKHKD
jgi:hypothetical protein